MSPRHLDLALRHKVLLIVPILAGLIAGIIWSSLTMKESFLSVGTVWVERPTIATGGSFTTFDQWISPAQNQVNAMQELLSTRSFRNDVLERAQNHPQMAPFENVTPQQLTQSTFITPTGTHTVSISHEASFPLTSFIVVDSILDAYSELHMAQIGERARASEEFFEEQLELARLAMERTNGELQSYLSANPVDADSRDEGSQRLDLSAAAAMDVELARLIGANETARENYERIFGEFAEIQIAANATAGSSSNFRVVDEPEAPLAPQVQGKRALLLQPMLGLVMGSFVSGGLFILLSRLDRRVWLPSDVERLGVGAPIMTLPHLKPPTKRWPKSFVRLSTALRSGLRGHSPA